MVAGQVRKRVMEGRERKRVMEGRERKRAMEGRERKRVIEGRWWSCDRKKAKKKHMDEPVLMEN